MESHYFMWWNVENLFDIENSANRPANLASSNSVRSYLKGWTKSVLDKKISQLSSIIKQVNGGNGPDLLGVCEIENEFVMNELKSSLNIPGRSYKVVHHDTKDERGIDVAFIYDSKKYQKIGKLEAHYIIKRTATRDIVEVKFKTKKGLHEFSVFGNHWPSRIPDDVHTEPFRMLTGETLSYWIKELIHKNGKEWPILVMGDFNDEPFNRSLTEYALSTPNREKVTGTQNPYLYNLMWEILGQRRGSFVYEGWPNVLDQIMVNENFLKLDSVFQVKNPAVLIEFPGMTKGKYKSPVAFRAPSKGDDFEPNGYSDHLPIAVIIEESTN